MDEIWKEIIEELFQDFCFFFMPDLAKDIDFSMGYEFLDKELLKIYPESKETKRFADKLVKVFFKDNIERWILIHIEVQGYNDKEFSRRMFVYFYRILDKYRKEIAAIAIFVDDNKNFKPSSFRYEFFDTKLVYKYKTYKILESSSEELMDSSNPFALVVLAARNAINAKNNEERKLKFKIELTRLLMQRGFTQDKIISIFRFIDGVLELDDEIKEKIFYEEVEKSGGDKVMQVIGNVEKRGYKRGMQQGLQEGLQQGIQQGMQEGMREGMLKAIRLGLDLKFGAAGMKLYPDIKKIKDIDVLDAISECIMSMTSLADIESIYK